MYVRRCSDKPCANIDVVFGKRANLDRGRMSRGHEWTVDATDVSWALVVRDDLLVVTTGEDWSNASPRCSSGADSP
jgi:hypothetical protein